MENKEKQSIYEIAFQDSIDLKNQQSISVSQRCLLCENTREFIGGCPSNLSPWVCDECKEAIAFIKKFKANY